MKLTQHISSRYITAANALQSQSSRRRIIAYVESYDDVFFWRTVLRQFENDRRYFEIMLPTQSRGSQGKTLARGKKSALQSILANAGSDMIACVDADYDYLMQRHTLTSRRLLDNPYAFHTYAYAIENLQCYAPGLYEVCIMATLTDHRIFDFEAFLRDYSTAVWPIFLWSVWFYRKEKHSIMSILDMDHITVVGKMSIFNTEQSLRRIRGRVKSKCALLHDEFPTAEKELQDLARELKALGINETNTYLYVHGHNLFEHIVLPVVTSVCKELRREREREIQRLSVHSTQMSNELSCYNNSIEDITSMLKKNTVYMQSEPIRKITERLRSVFGE